MSFKAHTCQIQYVGGPLDGHCEAIPLKQSALADVIAIPINGNVLAGLDGHERGAKSPASSVAVYELDVFEDACRYRFVGPTTPSQFRLDGWRG